MNLIIRNYFFFSLIFLAGLLSSCNVTKHLDTDKEERLLTKNTLNFKSTEGISLSKKTSLRYEMEGLFKQPATRRYMRIATWYRYKEKTSKFANFLNKKIAQQPSIFNEDLCQGTAMNFQNFMRKRGYFNASCSYKVKYKNDSKAEVEYLLDLGMVYKIASVELTSKDSNILQLLDYYRKDTELKINRPVDGRIFDSEKLRITNLLRDAGYAQFIPNYIEFTGDSTNHRVAVGMEILPFSSEKNNHPRYTVGNVTVFSSLVPDVNAIGNDADLNSIKYFSSEKNFFLLPRHLDKTIKVRPGELFRQSDLDQTYRNMSNLGAFRFVSVRPTPDSLRKDTMNVNIFFAPAKLSSVGYNFDLRYINTLGLIGVPTSVFYKHRNLFRGAEALQSNIIGNVEFNIGPDRKNPVYLWEVRMQNDLIIPRFSDYLWIWKGLHAIRIGDKRIVTDRMYSKLKSEAKAHIGVNANFISLNDFYTSGQIDAAFGYDMKTSGQKSYSITHVGLDWLQYYDFDPTFQALLLRFPLLARRTSDQLFTGFLLRSFTYNYHSKANWTGSRYGFRFSSDVSGLEIELANRIIQPGKVWKYKNELEFAKYVRLETGGNISRNLSKGILAGMALNTGVILPFGKETKTTPFVKQFSIGGASSIRAWQLRQLGPGRYHDVVNDTIRPYYQAADLKFEFLSEVRFPMFWYFKGAIFLDGGNIWALRQEPERPGARWYANSFRDLALGTGFGLRFDFGYSVIRFDLGMKLRKPYLDSSEDTYWVSWKQPNLKDFFDNVCTLNIAVGYPF